MAIFNSYIKLQEGKFMEIVLPRKMGAIAAKNGPWILRWFYLSRIVIIHSDHGWFIHIIADLMGDVQILTKPTWTFEKNDHEKKPSIYMSGESLKKTSFHEWIPMVYCWISSFHEIPSVSYLNPINYLPNPRPWEVHPQNNMVASSCWLCGVGFRRSYPHYTSGISNPTVKSS